MVKRRISFAISVGSLLALGQFSCDGCHDNGDGGDNPPPIPTPPPVCSPALDPSRSIVVNDPAALRDRFPLRRTLQAMVDSPSVGGTPEALLQSMLDSFDDPSFTNAGKTVPVAPRLGEKNLDVAKLLDPAPNAPDGMAPTGLFNRFDLAPKGGENCGEYRITYAKNQVGTPGRFLLIFEAKLPNPDLSQGIQGCKPITKFWKDLSDEPDANVRLDRLAQFYYDGIASADPVVRYANYGVPFGQVRSNLFINNLEWRLREHRANPVVAGGATFIPDTVKQNPLPELYRAGALPGTFTPADRQAFRDDFVAQQVCELTPDRANPGASQADVVNGIGSQFPNAFNDFESISQGGADNPSNGTDPAFSAAIATQLTTLEPGTTLSAADVARRAGAMSGGCHEFSNGVQLGNGNVWPASATFVHIQENGTLSNALTAFFMPQRAKLLGNFQCDLPTAPGPACPPAPAIAEEVSYAQRVADVEAAQQAYLAALAAPGVAEGDELAGLAKRLDETVEAARAAERALPGAFVNQRRTH